MHSKSISNPANTKFVPDSNHVHFKDKMKEMGIRQTDKVYNMFRKSPEYCISLF